MKSRRELEDAVVRAAMRSFGRVPNLTTGDAVVRKNCHCEICQQFLKACARLAARRRKRG